MGRIFRCRSFEKDAVVFFREDFVTSVHRTFERDFEQIQDQRFVIGAWLVFLFNGKVQHVLAIIESGLGREGDALPIVPAEVLTPGCFAIDGDLEGGGVIAGFFRSHGAILNMDLVFARMLDDALGSDLGRLIEGEPFSRLLGWRFGDEFVALNAGDGDACFLRLDGFGDDAARGFQVLFHQHGRDGENIADGIKAVAGIIRRQRFLDIEVHIQKVGDGVAILLAIHPADRHAARVRVVVIQLEDILLDPAGERGALGIRRLRFVGRRHQMGAHVFPNGHPMPKIRNQLRDRIMVIHGEVTLRHAIRMAVVAILGQQGLNLLFEIHG